MVDSNLSGLWEIQAGLLAELDSLDCVIFHLHASYLRARLDEIAAEIFAITGDIK